MADASMGPSVLRFARHHAFVVGIDAYERVSPLATAVSDALRVGRVLTEMQRFDVHAPLIDARGQDLRGLLHDTMPRLVGREDRVLFYFAGHGVAGDGDEGPAGYLVPADADPADPSTLVPMSELQEALQKLPCRHLLLILDCCFSGAFRWSSRTRAIGTLMPRRLYKERFDRFVEDAAWQVITSAAYDQKALDVLQGRATGDRGLADTRDDGERHSPFAQALLDGLSGEADARSGREGDGVITATELYAYIRDRVEPQTIQAGQNRRQTPGFFPLERHDKGEFIFLHPNHRLNLPPLPSRSPYKGLASFDEADRSLFYGRDRVIEELRARVEGARLLVVSGASGTGKSSVVKAGLLPRLRDEGHRILPVMRPGAHPLAALDAALQEVGPAGGAGAVLVIDQFEEVITRCASEDERRAFLDRLHDVVEDTAGLHRVIVTVRSDFEPQVSSGPIQSAWRAGRCTVPPFSLEELKEVVVMPTIQEVLIFDPPELVDEIVGEVVQAPGALPLLSYALSELYEAYRSSGRSDRALRKTDYDRLGGVMGALRTRADALYQSLSEEHQATMRRILLRMVSVEGELASRRVSLADLDYSPDENARVQHVIERLVEARLIVKGEGYIEPAHDALVRAWKTLHDWIHIVGRDTLLLAERLNPEADAFAETGDASLLWNRNPNLAVAARALEGPGHLFNAREAAFIRRSVARNRRRTRITWAVTAAAVLALAVLSVWALIERGTAQLAAEQAENEKNRAVKSLFSGLGLNMAQGQPGSVCAYGLCTAAPPGDFDEAAWLAIGRLPDTMPPMLGETPVSRDFAVARQFGQGHVVVYAHDGVTHDAEITPGSDNLAFAENALRWLTPLTEEEGCTEARTTVVMWEGTYVGAADNRQVLDFIERRGWELKTTSPETLDQDLHCAEVLWYLSDWITRPGFVERQVPRIEAFVQQGGGLLVGGLGWSFAQLSGPNGTPAIEYYPADLLGDAFGFVFTADAFEADASKIIRLQPGQ